MTKYVLIVNEILIKHIMIMSCHVMSFSRHVIVSVLYPDSISMSGVPEEKKDEKRRGERKEVEGTYGLYPCQKGQKLSWSREFLPTTQCSLLSSTSITPLGVNCSFPPSLTDYPDNSCLAKSPVSSQEER